MLNELAMGKLVLDTGTLSKLLQNEVLEICDAAGKTVGYFSPAVEQADYEGVQLQCSREELLRRAAEGGGRPLADILADLQQRS